MQDTDAVLLYSALCVSPLLPPLSAECKECVCALRIAYIALVCA